MDNQDISSFIAQKRAEKQSDEMILQELMAVGWDKNLVLQKLAGSQTPTPPPSSSPSSGVVTAQTGGVGAPIQLENVQYNVKLKKTRSKVGLASTISAIFGWLTAIMIVTFLLALRSMWLPDAGEDTSGAKEMIVFAIAVLVPVLPICIFAIKRLNKALSENPATVDDVFFKKSIRFNLILSLLAACGWAIVFVYNILAKIILHNQDLSRGAIIDGFLFFLPTAALVYLFWHYQKLTKR